MRNTQKYFLHNKIADFKKGYGDNLQYGEDGIRIASTEQTSRGAYLSPVLDSREKETLWHRVVIRADSLGDASLRFAFYASESRELDVDGHRVDVGDFLRSPDYSLERKQLVTEPFRVAAPVNATDLLIHEAVGRYLWYTVEMFGQGAESPVLKSVKIFLPRQTWIGFLPEVYQADAASRSFVERYLGIFQTLYDDMDSAIRNNSRFFDIDIVEGEFLQWMAGWVGIDDTYIWDEQKLRFLLQNAVRLYSARGTRGGVSGMVKLYTGCSPEIVERCMLDKYAGDARSSRLISLLYGDSLSMVTIVVHERDVPTANRYKTLLKIIESVKPAHIEVNLVVLKPYIFLDRYSYLGMNSVLGRYSPTSLNGFSAVSFTNISEPADRKDDTP